MKLRPYQEEFIAAAERSWADGARRVLGVAATGAGKTIMTSELMRRERGNCLFLADATELVAQNAAKYYDYAGEFAGVEMAGSTAGGFDRVVVASSQSMVNRLDRYDPDHFNLIVVDEAHRNTLGAMSQSILSHFGEYSRVLGVTGTPFRADRKELGDFYETISIDIGLDRLIREGWLSPITIKSVPMPVDLSKVGSSGGDYKASDLGEVIEPILREAAKQLLEHAAGCKKIVVFLPLIKTSIRMARICRELGMKAVHVSGEDRSQLGEFVDGDARVICNAQLLTTGWDCPPVDCIMVLRPTKSLPLYAQMVGRGTRLHPGKGRLLLLDPLYLTDDHRLINPARLVARDEEQAAAMMAEIREKGEGGDLIEVEDDIEEQRIEALKKRALAKSKRAMRLVDALEFALDSGDVETAEFEPEFGWEASPASERQIEMLEKAGIDIEGMTRGKASKVIDLLFMRRDRGLASPKQLRLLKRLGHPSPATETFEGASKWIDAKLGGRKGPQIPALLMLALRRAGLNPKGYSSEAEAREALAGAKTA